MIGALNPKAWNIKPSSTPEESEYVKMKNILASTLATGAALDQLYTKAPKSNDCEGCGAPLQRLAHHCEYCGRQA